MLFTALQCFTFMFALGFNCKPVEAYWKAFSATYTVDYHCSDTRIINPISGAMSVFSDAYAVALPMMMMRHFEMDIRKKIALNFVFSLGLIVVGAGIGRTYYLTKLGHSYDITWTAYDVLIWTQIEINFSLICASAPVLRILVRRYLREPMSRVMTANSHNRSGARSAMRNSLMTEPSGIGKVTYTPHRDSQDWGGNGDKNLIRHSVKPSLDTVKESARSTTPRSDGLGVKDIEAYAMSALKSSRPTSELTSSRPMSPDRGRNRPLPPLPQEDDASMQASLSEPFSATPWYGPNAAWHERHEKQG